MGLPLDPMAVRGRTSSGRSLQDPLSERDMEAAGIEPAFGRSSNGSGSWDQHFIAWLENGEMTLGTPLRREIAARLRELNAYQAEVSRMVRSAVNDLV